MSEQNQDQGESGFVAGALAGSLPEHQEGATMPPSTTRQRVLEAIEELPVDASVEDAIQRLVLLARIERAVEALDSERGTPHTEANHRLLPPSSDA